MKFVFLLLAVLLVQFGESQSEIVHPSLEQSVEILVDQWGVPHIYAENEHDLFFAQGYYAARDRLFQFEIWRRQATGTVAELLGERELKRDIGTRLFQFRGDIVDEMNHYHPRGQLIIESFVKGVNAYIDHVLADHSLLPIEFEILNMLPEHWTPEVVVSRHQGLLGNIGQEITTARQVLLLGEEKTHQVNYFHPNRPDLSLDPIVDADLMFSDILELYTAFRRTVAFQEEDLGQGYLDWDFDEESSLGSNNWVIDGTMTSSGYPMLANDPHRRVSIPSLRYMAHLHAPGWNVTGGGEPEIPGISIGHNEHGAWGLTVFRTDAEDLFVYRTNPENPNQYWYKGHWTDFQLISDTIAIKDKDPAIVVLKYSVHGPVLYEDTESNKACAMQCGWLEIGGSPYLASLRMNQSTNFEEFRDACQYSHIPGENMIWADREGNIGWQAVGIAPIRRHHSGMVPVPGDGRFDWDGYLPIQAKPNIYNPQGHSIITANENVTAIDYEYPEALGYSWSDPFRGDRVAEVLHSGRLHTVNSFAELQTDVFSKPAEILVPMLKHISFHEDFDEYVNQLRNWDLYLRPNSIGAGIYIAWERKIRSMFLDLVATEDEKRIVNSIQFTRILEHLTYPTSIFGDQILEGRDEFLKTTFQKAIQVLKTELGDDMNQWQYGQEKYKHSRMEHDLSDLVSNETKDLLNVGPLPRGGNGYTVGSTGGNNQQSSGATFKFIVDVANWDHCLAMNSPGQSGNPESPFYKNLFAAWAKDQYFPLFFSREKIEEVTVERLNLIPGRD